MASTPLKYLNQYITTTLSVVGGIDASQTTGIVIQSSTGLETTKAGVALLSYADPLNTTNSEWITYTAITAGEFQGVTRGAEGGTGKVHANGVTIAFPLSESHINNLNAMFDTTGLDIAQISTPANPDSGRNKLYFKSNGGLYSLTSAGVEEAVSGEKVFGIQVVDAGTDTATGDAKAYFTVPSQLNGFNLTAVKATVYTAGTTNTTDIQIRNKTQTADMLSTKITIDSTETDSATAATPAVIDTSNDDVATGDVIAIDVDAVNTTAAKGLFVLLTFTKP